MNHAASKGVVQVAKITASDLVNQSWRFISSRSKVHVVRDLDLHREVVRQTVLEIEAGRMSSFSADDDVGG